MKIDYGENLNVNCEHKHKEGMKTEYEHNIYQTMLTL